MVDAEGSHGSDAIRVMICDDHALFRRGLDHGARVRGGHRGRRRGRGRRGGHPQGRGARPRRRAHGRPHAHASAASRPPAAIAEVDPDRQDPHAHGQRRGGRPLRRDQGRRHRLPAQGDLHRGGRRRHPGRGQRPEPDLPVDGLEAAHRVHQPGQAGRREAGGARRPASPTASSRCSSSSPRA